MAESEVLTAARRLITELDEWEGPNQDWSRLEAEGTVRVEDLLATWRWLAEQVINADGSVLPENAPTTARYLVTTAENIATIGAFDIATDNSRNQFHQLLSAVQTHLQNSLNETGVWACQHAARRADKPAGRVSEQLREAEEKLEKIKEHEGEAKAAREGAKSAAAKAGAAVFTDSFKTSAGTAQEASQRWLRAGLGSALVTIGVALWFVLGEAGGAADDWLWLQPLTGRLFLLSVLTYVTVWCGRRSLAERHNARVNDHRANSIQTIQAFRESANAEATKDAVVLEAARAIFENVQTGDLGASPDSPSIAKTIELVRPLGDSRA